jgi:aryl-alcohol dehydrogenase-like predicted oxidoreductase
MEYRTLGRTGLRVSLLGFGAAEVGYDRASPTLVRSLLDQAIAAGMNVVDTAECYRDSETLVGKALAGRRDDVVLFTKCGHASEMEGEDWNRHVLERSIDRSLKRLRTDHVDILQLHSCSLDVLNRGDAIEVVEHARRAGKARFIGYSGDGTAAVQAIQSGRFDVLMTSINIVDQEAIDLTLPLAAEREMGIVVKRPMANVAWMTDRAEYGDTPVYRHSVTYNAPYVARLNELGYDFMSKEASVTLALRFTVGVRGVHSVIVGTTNESHLIQNIAAALGGPLDPDLHEAVRNRWHRVARPDWVGQQ